MTGRKRSLVLVVAAGWALVSCGSATEPEVGGADAATDAATDAVPDVGKACPYDPTSRWPLVFGRVEALAPGSGGDSVFAADGELYTRHLGADGGVLSPSATETLVALVEAVPVESLDCSAAATPPYRYFRFGSDDECCTCSDCAAGDACDLCGDSECGLTTRSPDQCPAEFVIYPPDAPPPELVDLDAFVVPIHEAAALCWATEDFTPAYVPGESICSEDA